MVRLSHGKMIYEEVYQKKYQGIRSKGCSAWVFPVDIGCIGGPVYLASNSIMVNNRKESKSINKSLEIIMMLCWRKAVQEEMDTIFTDGQLIDQSLLSTNLKTFKYIRQSDQGRVNLANNDCLFGSFITVQIKIHTINCKYVIGRLKFNFYYYKLNMLYWIFFISLDNLATKRLSLVFTHNLMTQINRYKNFQSSGENVHLYRGCGFSSFY